LESPKLGHAKEKKPFAKSRGKKEKRIWKKRVSEDGTKEGAKEESRKSLLKISLRVGVKDRSSYVDE